MEALFARFSSTPHEPYWQHEAVVARNLDPMAEKGRWMSNKVSEMVSVLFNGLKSFKNTHEFSNSLVLFLQFFCQLHDLGRHQVV